MTKGTGKEVTTEDLLASYHKHHNVWKVGEELGIRGQTVHRRLSKIGVIDKMNVFTPAEINRLKTEYVFYADRGRLSELAALMGRTKPYICRMAGKLGLTDQSRNRSYLAETTSKNMKAWIAKNGHPRGATGIVFSLEAREKMRASSKKWWEALPQDKKDAHAVRMRGIANAHLQERHKASWKCAWHEIGGTRSFYRSRWESNYAYYLEWLKSQGLIAKWEHEPHTFWFEGIKRGCVSYLPDFRVTENDGRQIYHEVKGWMDDRSKTKIARMAKYHPDVKLIVIDSKGYKAIAAKVGGIVPGWEAEAVPPSQKKRAA